MVRQRGDDRLGSIVDSGTERVDGRAAWRTNVAAGRALADTVRTTLGPKGADTMVITAEGKVVVTNDGTRIIDLIEISHPTAELLADLAAEQASEVGDGTTTAILLAGELLARAEELLDRGVHPTTIAAGYHLAAERASTLLDSYAFDIRLSDRERLEALARTIITGRWDRESRGFLASLFVDLIGKVEREGMIEHRRITRRAIPGGRPRDSTIVNGLPIDTERSSTSLVTPRSRRPDRIEDATIALLDDGLRIETVDGLERVSLDGPEDRQELLAYEESVYAEQADRVAATGANVLFCQQSIDDPVTYLLAERGILAVERTRRDELIQLARATGARHVGTIAELSSADVGHAGVLERRRVGGRELLVLSECAGNEQLSLLLRGGPEHVVEELDRIAGSCLRALGLAIEQGAVLPGGGACETRLAGDLRAEAKGVDSREQLAIEAFADALEVIPWTLAENAGLEPIDALTELRARHHAGENTVGLDLEAGEGGRIRDILEAGVIEPLAVPRRAIESAAEAASTLVRVDDVIAAERNGSGEEERDDHDHGPGGLESTEGYPWAVGHSMGH
jgi:chaperonin GroEL (HSP60 family)